MNFPCSGSAFAESAKTTPVTSDSLQRIFIVLIFNITRTTRHDNSPTWTVGPTRVLAASRFNPAQPEIYEADSGKFTELAFIHFNMLTPSFLTYLTRIQFNLFVPNNITSSPFTRYILVLNVSSG